MCCEEELSRSRSVLLAVVCRRVGFDNIRGRMVTVNISLQVSFAILDAQMCIVMSVLMAVWLPYDVTLTFPLERRIFLRERKAGLYTTSSFYCARIT